MSNLLVTGGAGFIGSHFANYWAEKYPEDKVTVLDSLYYAGDPKNLRLEEYSNLKLVVGDICDTTVVHKVLREEEITTVVNFAAESHVDTSIENPSKFLNTNVVGTMTLLSAFHWYWKNRNDSEVEYRFHQVSTDEVYGSLSDTDPAFTEISRYEPNSPYSASKASADHFVRAFNVTYGLPTTISNCSNNYGTRHHPEKLIPKSITRMLLGEDVPLYGSGTQIRDWLHVEDHIRGIELILKKGRAGKSYNLGGGTELTNLELLEIISKSIYSKFWTNEQLKEAFPNCPSSYGVSPRVLIKHVKDRPGHDTRYAIDFTKAKSELGFEPRVGIWEGISDTIEWYAQNKPWWETKL